MTTRIQEVIEEIEFNEELAELVTQGILKAVTVDGKTRFFASEHAPAVTLPAATVVAELGNEIAKLKGSIGN